MRLVLVIIVIVALLLGFAVGLNVDVYDYDCLAAQAIYERAVDNFKEDLFRGADDTIVIADEYRKFEFYMEMTDICKDE